MKSALISLFAGLLLASLFPGWNLSFLAFLALLPQFYLLEKETGLRRCLLPLLSYVVFFMLLLYWIPRVMVLYGGLSWVLSVSLYLLLCVALALFYAPTVLVFIFMRRTGSALAYLAFPFGWVSCDLVRNFWMVNGFPWGSLGYTQVDFLWGQIADLGGIYAVTFLVVSVNCLVALAFVSGARMWPTATILALVVSASVYGFRRTAVSYAPSNLIVGAVQPGIELDGSESYLRERYFSQIPAMVRKLASQGARLVVLPEAPTVFNYYQDRDFAELINRLAADLRVALIFNNTQSDGLDQYYNSMVFVRADGSSDTRYDKIHLVPFGEYVPGARWLFFVRPLVREVANFYPGSEPLVAELGGLRVGGFICYEAIFPELVRMFSAAGAELLVNITDDAWYGRSAAPLQHFQMVRMRAIESRRFLVRSANTGISAVVDPSGRVKVQLGLFETGELLAGARPLQQVTFYVRHGDLFVRSCAMIFGASLFVLRIYGRKRIDRRTAAEV